MLINSESLRAHKDLPRWTLQRHFFLMHSLVTEPDHYSPSSAQDLADKVFTSDVLEREERITQITEDLVTKALAARHAAANPSQTPSDARDEHGLDELARLFQAEVSGVTGKGPGSEMALPQFSPSKAQVPEALRGSGVLYAHRNEEVVGKGSRKGERAKASWAWGDAAQLQQPRAEVRESGARRMLANAGRPTRMRRRGVEDEGGGDAAGGPDAGERDGGGEEEAGLDSGAAPTGRPPKRPRFRYVEEEEEEAGPSGRASRGAVRATSEDDVATLRVPANTPRGLSEDDMATLRVVDEGPEDDPEDDEPTLRVADVPNADLDDVATLRMDGGGLGNLQEVYDTQKESLFEEGQDERGRGNAAPTPVADVERKSRKSESAGANVDKGNAKQSRSSKVREIELVLEEMARMRGESTQQTLNWLKNGKSKKDKLALQEAAKKKLKEQKKI